MSKMLQQLFRISYVNFKIEPNSYVFTLDLIHMEVTLHTHIHTSLLHI